MIPENTSKTEVVWESDKEVANCHDCNQRFTLFVRRHHCRRCGLIFCSDCSFHSISLPNLGFREAVRVCSPCFRIELEKRNNRSSIPRASLESASGSREKRSQFSSRESSDNEELEKYKEIIKEQQKAIEVLMSELDIKPEHLDNLLRNPQNIPKRHRSSSTPQVNQQPNSLESIPSSSQSRNPSSTLTFSQSLREGNTSRLKMPLPQFQKQLEPTTPTPLPFDEEIAETIVAMGYPKPVVIGHLLNMAQKGMSINLADAIDYVVSYQGRESVEQYRSTYQYQQSAEEDQLREQLQETEKKLIEYEEQMQKLQHVEEKKEEEIAELKLQVHMLERIRREKDTQIEILTGGFGFGTFLKVHGGVDIMEESECIICMDQPKSYRTSCGCKVICGQCYKPVSYTHLTLPTT
eukprot:TRINITY_DN191_c0_g1_i2.p1 TRINITY_DN191_c0_g1~~TRINITY_DN191_c0_g1_i2.p1  ORF type:complete len:408 (+),score=72.42 TRINITY_DN191_c0_g1_i2:126-1349(+)